MCELRKIAWSWFGDGQDCSRISRTGRDQASIDGCARRNCDAVCFDQVASIRANERRERNREERPIRNDDQSCLAADSLGQGAEKMLVQQGTQSVGCRQIVLFDRSVIVLNGASEFNHGRGALTTQYSVTVEQPYHQAVIEENELEKGCRVTNGRADLFRVQRCARNVQPLVLTRRGLEQCA